ncbi:MAG: RagB/SusD family nutrient uptake outer membrane protein [Segetibacter sp.]|nr:RagB/SusD family nutrient uptake outer membrane protein [Segetibacter sp.]
MKSLRNIISAVLAVAIFINTTSCLKENLKDIPTPSLIKNTADVTAVINGAYSQFNDAAAFKFQGMMMLFLCADDIYADGGAEPGAYGGRTFTGVNTAPFWNKLYSTIANANDLIATLDRLNLDSTFEQRAYGEAYFLRAFSYYYLVRLYGGVPLRLEAVDVNSNFYLPRKTIDEVYAQIFSDFKMASALLPLYSKISAAELGRASKGAAQAIMAQAYLTYGNQLSLKGQPATTQYQNAIVHADSVIASGQYTLLNNYGDLFEITKETGAYSEVIFGVRFQTDQQARAQPAAGSEFALRFGSPNTHFISGNGTTGSGDASMKLMHWFADYYRTGDYSAGTGTTQMIDYRNEKAFYQKGFNSTQNKYYAVYPNLPVTTADGTINTPLIAKYIDPSGKDSRNNGNDLFIIRLAEVYLIKAEAENEINGPTAAAQAAFNQVRARARQAGGTPRAVPSDVATNLTRDQFRLKIFDERGLELVGEGQRWFDLVRMHSPLSATQTMYEYQFKTVLPAKPQTLPTYNATSKKYSNTDAVYAPALKVSVPKFLLFPIPSSEILQNLNFGLQNPGW